MKFAGRVYVAKGGEAYLAVYSPFEDVYVKDFARGGETPNRVAHARYGYGGARKGIEVFRLNDRFAETERVTLTPAIRHTDLRNDLGMVDSMHAISYEVVQSDSLDVNSLMDFLRQDVLTFCHEKGYGPAKKPSKRELLSIGEIVPETAIRYVPHSKEFGMLSPGKKEFVAQCKLEANLDFGKGCITSWIPEGNEASFDGKKFRGYWHAPLEECTYCYAGQGHETFAKNIFKHNPERLKEELLGAAKLQYGIDKPVGKKVKVLRLGKRTETGAPFFRETLISTLETCLETGTRVVMPTKMLDFDPEVADLFRRTRSSIFYSMGDSKRETGTLAHGCDDAFKTEQAIKYAEAGVKSNYYLMMHGHAKISEREQALIDVALGAGVKIQLLPERFNSRAEFGAATGLDWGIAKGDDSKILLSEDSLFEEQDDAYADTYYLTGDNNLSPLHSRMNSDWLNLMKTHPEEISMCHHDTEILKCGTCAMAKPFEAPFREVTRVKIDKPGREWKDQEEEEVSFPFGANEEAPF